MLKSGDFVTSSFNATIYKTGKMQAEGNSDTGKNVDPNSTDKLEKIVAMMGSDQPGIVDAAGIQMARWINRTGKADEVAKNLSYIFGGNGKPTPAELETLCQELKTANGDYEIQNTAIRAAYDRSQEELQRLQRKRESRNKNDPPESEREILNVQRGHERRTKGLLRNLFATAAPGAAMLGAAHLGIPLPFEDPLYATAAAVYSGYMLSNIATDENRDQRATSVLALSLFAPAIALIGTAAGFLINPTAGKITAIVGTLCIGQILTEISSEWNSSMDTSKCLWGALSGAFLSAALAFSAVSYQGNHGAASKAGAISAPQPAAAAAPIAPATPAAP